MAVTEHYQSDGIVARILEALSAEGVDRTAVRASDLTPFDQLHGREIAATMDHVARLGCGPEDKILDVGCGIGGPARFIATQCKSKVCGIDLTSKFIEAAVELTELCSLSERVTFQQGDARSLPFDDNTFDGAICFYVGMNLPDRFQVLSEIRRVLKPGGRLVWTDAVVVAGGVPVYPLPWAASEANSFLVSADELRDLVRHAGLYVTRVESETGPTLEAADNATRRAPLTAKQRIANEVVLGEAFIERRQNYIRSLASGALDSVLLEATK